MRVLTHVNRGRNENMRSVPMEPKRDPPLDSTELMLLVAPMARALLQELQCKLAALARDGHTARIDLHRLPLPVGTLETLRAWLGRGEAEATVRSLGTTTFTETSVAGIWWVREAKADGTSIGESLEVSLCPSILAAHPTEVIAGAELLEHRLAALPEGSMAAGPSSGRSANPR